MDGIDEIDDPNVGLGSVLSMQVRIPAKMTAHSGERDRCAHRIGAGESFLIQPVTISQVGSAICMSILVPVALLVGSDGVLPSLLKNSLLLRRRHPRRAAGLMRRSVGEG